MLAVDFMKSLPGDLRAELVARHKWAGLVHLTGHLGAILAIGAWIALGGWGCWLLFPVQGILLVFLFTLEHECTHRTPFASDALCDWVGRFCGLVLLLPFTWFRYFHLAHHRFTNLEGQDPELGGPEISTRRAWLWHVSGLPYWGAQIRTVLRLVAGTEAPAYLPKRARAQATKEARIMMGIYVAAGLTLIWTSALFWVWILPVLIAQPALRLYLLAEHGDCPRVADMFANTRTVFTTVLIRFVAWNMPYHVEHHVAPTVPFHNLPKLHRLMRAHLQITAPGYRQFTRDYLARRSS